MSAGTNFAERGLSLHKTANFSHALAARHTICLAEYETAPILTLNRTFALFLLTYFLCYFRLQGRESKV